jgi:uncharacterized membrane protein
MAAASRDSKGRHDRSDRFMAAIRDRSVLALAAVTVAGITLVASGWVIQGQAYVPGLLMQLGTSMMLLVPLALLGFILENRMRRAEEQIRATAAQLDTLTAVTRQRLAEHRQQREDLFSAANRNPTQEMLRSLLGEAVEVGAIAAGGARVQLPGHPIRVRFRPDDADVAAQAEEPDGTALGLVPWHAGEPVTIFAERLAARLRAVDRYPGDSSFDPTALLQRLLKLVQLGIEARTGERARDLGPLIETPNEQWAISSEGLFSLQRPYHIPVRRIIGSHEDWPRYMRTQAWVDAAAFDEAYLLARQLLQAGGDKAQAERGP